MKHTLLYLTLLLLPYSLLPAQERISWEQIPNVQLQDSTRFVSDVAVIIDEDTERHINDILQSLRQTQGVEGVVVTLPSLGKGGDIERLALEILRGWGVGSKIDNSGFVLLVSLDSRQIRIETGYGLEGTLPDATCSQIIAHRIVPHFKRGEYSVGILSGVQAIQETLISGYEGATRTDREVDATDASRLLSGILIVLSLIIWSVMHAAYKRRQVPPMRRLRNINVQLAIFIVLAVLMSLGGTLLVVVGPAIIVIVAIYAIYRVRLVREDRRCDSCHQNALRELSPTQMLSLLTPSEQLEQRLHSMRYLVKQCDHCGATQKYSEVAASSSYKKCPHCGTRALKKVASRRLSSLDPRVDYIRRIEYHCLYCDQDHHDDRKVFVEDDDSSDLGAAILGGIIGSSLGRRGFGGGFGGGGFGGGSGGGGGATGSW